jgi:hypothetical protein
LNQELTHKYSQYERDHSKKTVSAAIGNKAIRSMLKSAINKEIKKKLYSVKRESIPAFVEKRYYWYSALI